MVDNPLCQLALVNLYHSEAVVPVTSGDQKFVVRREDKQVMADSDVLSKWCTNILPRSVGGGAITCIWVWLAQSLTCQSESWDQIEK